jgi:tetratricopeptide (TPR) repeat protein
MGSFFRLRNLLTPVRCGGAAILCVAMVCLTFGVAEALGQDEPLATSQSSPIDAGPSESTQDATIALLIEQLAADDFARRERAQAELSQLGLEAFDALHLAQNHHEPEIALRARYLVRSMSVRWFAESDAPQVVSILKGYGDLVEHERRSRIDRLAALENRAGLVPLARLSRFETSEPMAKYAALKLLQAGAFENEAERAALARSIEQIVGKSRRTAAGWLRQYARTLEDPAATVAEWDRFTQDEQVTLAKNSHLTSEEIVRDLYRFQVELLDRLDRHDEALAVIRRTFQLLKAEAEEVIEVVDWLLARRAYPVALELLGDQRFARLMEDSALLLYRLAETHQRLGESEKAAEVAERALALRPENAIEHTRIAHILGERGFHTWAEREYRAVLSLAPLGSTHDVLARFSLSELLHDVARELAAAEVLQPLCELMEKDAAAREAVERRRPMGATVSRMHYFFACHFHEQGDAAKEREHLEKAIAANKQDVDVLIAMYRLPQADEAWQRSTREQIEAQAAETRQQIERSEAEIVQSDSEAERAGLEEDLSQFCNEYAWLVSNTFGDFDDAVKRSHRSLEIKPNYYVYLDTLGRCYFAKGDFVNAIKYQLQAVQGSHSGQIQRQLDFFLKEAEAAGAKLPDELVKVLAKEARGP